MRTPRHAGPLALLAAFVALATTACEQAPTSPAGVVSSGPDLRSDATPSASALDRPGTPLQVNLTFDKTLDEDLSEEEETLVWTGSVDGDLQGDLTSMLLDARESGPILHVDFRWIIENGNGALVFETSGILNSNTGAVVMNGTVTEDSLTGDDLEGARVHEEGQAQDPDGFHFEGIFTIMRMTAG